VTNSFAKLVIFQQVIHNGFLQSDIVLPASSRAVLNREVLESSFRFAFIELSFLSAPVSFRVV
jgi:hypothetical protein